MLTPLASAPIAAREPERRAEELLNELLKSYFTGVVHKAPLGDAVFDRCALYFNQTEIIDPGSEQGDEPPRSQIHAVFSDFKPKETWFLNAGGLGTWAETLDTPASGVAYGLRVGGGIIEESIHGALARIIAGDDIRWQVSGPDFIEQVLLDGTWTTVRSFAGGSARRWTRVGGNYVEQIFTDAWTDARILTPSHGVWDGTKKLVTAEATVSFYIRSVNSGADGERVDFRNRRVAGNLLELLQSDDSHRLLGPKGLRRFRVLRGPTALMTTGYQVRLIVATTTFRYYLPRQL